MVLSDGTDSQLQLKPAKKWIWGRYLIQIRIFCNFFALFLAYYFMIFQSFICSNFVPHILLFLVQCAHFHRPHEHNKKEGELSIKSNSNRKPPKSLSESELKKYACIILGLYLGLDFRVRVRLSLGLVYRFGLGLVYGFGLV